MTTSLPSLGISARERFIHSDTRHLRVSVVICAYSEKRWEQTRAAVESTLTQDPAPAQVLLVIDHNTGLAKRARNELPGITVLESDDVPGLSGARNTGLRAATQPVTAFLDDDAQARPGWLASLVEPYRSPDVVATGGTVNPWWPGTSSPLAASRVQLGRRLQLSGTARLSGTRA